MVRIIGIAVTVSFIFGCVGNNTTQVTGDLQSELDCLEKNINNADKCLTEVTKKRVGLKCQYVEVSGTRFKQKQCTTLAQRESKQGDAADQMKRMRGNGTSFPQEKAVP